MGKDYLVTKNIVFNFGGQIILLLLGIFTAPFIIHTLGNNLYGVFALVNVVVGYFSILDLGLGLSIIKYISDYHTQSDKEGLEKVLGTALSAYIVIGFIGAGLILLFTNLFLGRVLHIPPEVLPTALTVFYISAFGFLVNMILTVVNSIPPALQRMDIQNSRNVIFGVISTFGTVLLLALGQGLTAVVIWNILISLVATAVFFSIILKLVPKVSIRPIFDKEIFKKLMRFGFFKFLSNVSGQVVFQLDRLLIAAFHPVAFVTFYTAPTVIAQKGLMIVLNVNNAVFPAMSQAHTLGDMDRARDLYLRMAKFITFLMLPLAALLFVLSDLILLVWLGPEFSLRSALALKILALAYFMAAMSAPGVVAADAFGKPQIASLFAGISAVINFIAAIILIPRFGIEGAALALLINFVVQVPIFILVVNKKLIKVSNLKFLRYTMLKPIFSGIIASLILFQVTGFLQGLLGLITGAIIFGIVYLAINLILGTIEQRDKKAAIYLLGKVSESLRRG